MKKYVYSFGEGIGRRRREDERNAGRQGRRARRDEPRQAARPARIHHRHRCLQYLFPQRKQSARRDRRRDGQSAGTARKAHGAKAGRHAEPAAGQRALRREILHAGHDGHHPQPRPERQNRGGARKQERQSAFRAGLLPALHTDVRQRGAGYRETRFRSPVRGPQEKGARQIRYRSHRRRSQGHHRRVQKAGPEKNRQAVPAGRARAARHGARRRVSAPGMASAPSTTAG